MPQLRGLHIQQFATPKAQKRAKDKMSEVYHGGAGTHRAGIRVLLVGALPLAHGHLCCLCANETVAVTHCFALLA